MKKTLMILAAVLCCATATMAQMTQEQALKEAEEKARLADKHPENGKMNLQAAWAERLAKAIAAAQEEDSNLFRFRV